jgi:FMN phosphatase YigB (HAD superfamily)
MDKTLLNKVEIFGVSGKLGTGKNYISERVFMKMMEPVPTVILSFADQIKVNVIVQKNVDRHKCFVDKDEHTRKMMQRVGTEEGRNVYGHDIWLKFTLEWMLIHASRGIKRIIVPDVRFHNEFDFIKDLGGTMVRVNAPKRNLAAREKEASKGVGTAEQIGAHVSETELDHGRTFDYVIDNDIDAPTSMFVQVRDMIRDIQHKQKKDLVIFCDLDNTVCECNEYYILQAEKVKGLIEQNLRGMPMEDFEERFSASVRKHNGDYSHSFFHRSRFAQSMVDAVGDFADEMLEESDILAIKEKAREWGYQVFDYSYEAIDGRVEQLRELRKLGDVVLFTMGDRLEQVKKIAELGLMEFPFEVFDYKDATIYRHLCAKYDAKTHCMIGDSLQRDVLPALEAGLPIVIRITDKKESYWNDDGAHDKKYHQAEDLKEASDIIKDYVFDKEHQRVKSMKYLEDHT